MLVDREVGGSGRSGVPPLCTSGDGDGVFPRSTATLIAWVRRWKPDVVVGFDEWEYEALRPLTDKSGTMPDFDCLSLNPRPEGVPKVSGMDLNLRAVGGYAVELLDQQIRHRHVGIPRVAQDIAVSPTFR